MKTKVIRLEKSWVMVSIIILALLFLALTSSVAFAEEDGTAAGNTSTGAVETTSVNPAGTVSGDPDRPVIKGIRKDVRDTVKDVRTNVRDARTDLRKDISDHRNTLRENLDAKKTDIKNQLDAKKTDIRTSIQEKRGEFKDLSPEERAAKEAELRALRDEKRGELDQARDEKREELKEARDANRDEFKRKALERIKAYVERIVKRLNAALERFHTMAGRIESRILKLEERGVDTTEAREFLRIANAAIDEARSDVAAILPAVEDVLASDTPKDSFQKIRELIREAVAGVKEAHKALVDAIRAVKAAIPSTDVASTDDNSSDE